MKQIKTIIERYDFENAFDRRVNAALADGWQLAGRAVIKGVDGRLALWPHLIAELEKEVPDAE